MRLFKSWLWFVLLFWSYCQTGVEADCYAIAPTGLCSVLLSLSHLCFKHLVYLLFISIYLLSACFFAHFSFFSPEFLRISSLSLVSYCRVFSAEQRLLYIHRLRHNHLAASLRLFNPSKPLHHTRQCLQLLSCGPCCCWWSDFFLCVWPSLVRRWWLYLLGW